MKRRPTSVTRFAVGLAVAGFAVVVGLALYRLMREDPSKATAQRLVIAQVAAAFVAAAAAVTGTLWTVRRSPDSRVRRSDLVAPKLTMEARLVDRSTEMSDLVAQIDTGRVVGCHGLRGAGKSFLLQYLTDLVNGHRSPARGRPRP